MTIQYESNYYGVSTLGDSLMHHGIKGQKWGVRRYQNPDGTYTDAGARRRAKYLTSEGGLTKKGTRKFRKEYKKLQKLQDRADVNKQRELAEKYNRRAKTAGKVALGAGAATGLANAASKPLLYDAWDKAAYTYNHKLSDQQKLINSTYDSTVATNNALRKLGAMSEYDYFNAQDLARKSWGDATAKFNNDREKVIKKLERYSKADDILPVATKVGTVVAAVSAGAAIYNKVQAHAAKKRTTELGHDKAVQDVKKQMERMHDMFGDVKITDLQKKKAS